VSTPVEIAAIAAPTILALAGLATVAVAREWVNITVSVAVKAIPAAKRRPRTAVDVKVIPGTVEQPAATPIAARRTGT
jgi:hypothetical protein